MNCIIIGAGGHARVVLENLRGRRGLKILGFTDSNKDLWKRTISGIKILGSDDRLAAWRPGSVRLINGLGAAADTRPRSLVFAALKKKGHAFLTVTGPTAVVPADWEAGEGAQILTRAVIHPGTRIGADAVVNTAAVVEHDCVIEDHAFIGPGAVLCGEVTIGAGAFVGAGAVLLPGVRVGADAVVGAGSVVIRDLGPGTRSAGNPARGIQ